MDKDLARNLKARDEFRRFEPSRVVNLHSFLRGSGDKLNDVGGNIYVFSEVSGSALYVGRTLRPVKRRIKEHVKYPTNINIFDELCNRSDQIQVAVYMVPEDWKVDLFERGAYLALRPIHNQQIPQVQGEYRRRGYLKPTYDWDHGN
jgi:hypothetical protein